LRKRLEIISMTHVLPQMVRLAKILAVGYEATARQMALWLSARSIRTQILCCGRLEDMASTLITLTSEVTWARIMALVWTSGLRERLLFRPLAKKRCRRAGSPPAILMTRPMQRPTTITSLVTGRHSPHPTLPPLRHILSNNILVGSVRVTSKQRCALYFGTSASTTVVRRHVS